MPVSGTASRPGQGPDPAARLSLPDAGSRSSGRATGRLFRLVLIGALALPFLEGCTQPRVYVHAHEMLNATLWQQSSAEYQGLARQVYRLATENLDRALADPRWHAALEQEAIGPGLPPAIMLDLDETVLDNGRYEGRIIRRYGRYSPETFAQWCEEASAPAVPGVAEFLDHAATRGVAIFYYSARREHLRECTARNLIALGLPLPDRSRLLLDNGAGKSNYRHRVTRDYRVLLLVGDNLEDFVAGSKAAPEARRALARRHAERWGREWILLPNPMYGHWEAGLHDFDYRLPRAEQLRRKFRALRE